MELKQITDRATRICQQFYLHPHGITHQTTSENISFTRHNKCYEHFALEYFVLADIHSQIKVFKYVT